MQITNLNPASDIGASAWFVEIDGHNILLDAGTHPKHDGRAALPLYDLVRDKDVDAVALTHCHHDHVGSLPVALQHFPDANVYMSELSYFIVERVLHNSVNVMKRKRAEGGVMDYPLFTHRQVDDIAYLFQGCKYNHEFVWGQEFKGADRTLLPTMEFLDAGHALGSAGVMVRGKNRTLFYTGDVCFQDQTILKGAAFEDVKADVLVMETTRGTREVVPGFSREKEIERLVVAVEEVLAGNGSVLIPTFALGRSQEILALLAVLMQEGRLKRQPLFIGGLGRVFTEIYDLEAHRVRRNLSNLRLTEALDLQVLGKGKLESMKLGGGKIFVITAGMMSEHTAAHELAIRMAGDERHGIFFVGYADPSTPGGRLKAAPKGEPFFFSQSGGELTRRCRMEDYDLTAHANRDELLDLVGRVDPETVILGHGDGDSREWFEARIHERHPKLKVSQLAPGESLEA
jgi:Cft2 family RNA processing exonuclease